MIFIGLIVWLRIIFQVIKKSRSVSPALKSFTAPDCFWCSAPSPHLSWQHFHDGRKAQQHIESSWKQLETVSDLINHARPVPCWREAVAIGQRLLLLSQPKRLIPSKDIYKLGDSICSFSITGCRSIKWTLNKSDIIINDWKHFKSPNRIKTNAAFKCFI